jgi:hypothetical protein
MVHRRITRSKSVWALVGLPMALAVLPATKWPSARLSGQKTPETWTSTRRSLHSLLAVEPSQLRHTEIATLNLLSAEGLPGTEGLNQEECLANLQAWAIRVRSETQRHLYRFQRNPGEFNNSEGFFRMLIMAVVLAEDFQIRYNPARISQPGERSITDGFFADSREVFVHGLLGPRRMGTCSSMPVLYVALGRRLGYPVSLVTTKGHLFVRWESPKERFNVETTARGMEHYDDEYYKQWPFPLTDDEAQAEGYLKSLTPPEELAVFLSIRGMCLREAGRHAEAAEAFAAAVRLAPNCRSYRLMLASLRGQKEYSDKRQSVQQATLTQ